MALAVKGDQLRPGRRLDAALFSQTFEHFLIRLARSLSTMLFMTAFASMVEASMPRYLPSSRRACCKILSTKTNIS